MVRRKTGASALSLNKTNQPGILFRFSGKNLEKRKQNERGPQKRKRAARARRSGGNACFAFIAYHKSPVNTIIFLSTVFAKFRVMRSRFAFPGPPGVDSAFNFPYNRDDKAAMGKSSAAGNAERESPVGARGWRRRREYIPEPGAEGAESALGRPAPARRLQR